MLSGSVEKNRESGAPDEGGFVDVTLANHVESMLENANAPSERIICDDHWEELFVQNIQKSFAKFP